MIVVVLGPGVFKAGYRSLCEACRTAAVWSECYGPRRVRLAVAATDAEAFALGAGVLVD